MPVATSTAWAAILDIATILTGVGATVTAFYSLRLSGKALSVQDNHNKLSLKPIPYVAMADYEHFIRVKFVNDGAGPFIIKSIQVCLNNDVYSDLISWMPYPPDGISWTSFTSNFKERALLPNNDIILLELTGDPTNTVFCAFRDVCREKLSLLRIILEYTDIYGQTFPKYHHELAWFGRDKGTRKSAKVRQSQRGKN